MDIRWNKSYKPKRKLYLIRTLAATGYESFCEEIGYNWYERLVGGSDTVDNRAMYYLPEKMCDDGYSRICGGIEVAYSSQNPCPEGCEEKIIPGFDVVDLVGFPVELLDDIPRLITSAYSYAKLYIENEKVNIVTDNKIPYIIYMENPTELRVEIPIWSVKTRMEEMLTVDRLSKKDLYNLAYRDVTTGFYNWTWLKEKLEQCKYIGYDRFVFGRFDIKNSKVICNVFGHDEELAVYKMICKTLTEQDFIIYSAKCENDNFAMIMKYMPEEELVTKIHAMFEKIGTLPSNKKFNIFYRCGLVEYNEADNLKLTMSMNEMAIMAQEKGIRNNETEIIYYTEEMKRSYIMAQQFKVELPNAIENEDLAVFLQPKYNPQNDKLTGAEALIRWFYKGEDLLPPKYFVPQFEADGTIDIIDRYVLRQVCRKFQEWKVLGYPLYPISVNLSRHQIVRPDLIYILCDIVDEYNVDHGLIDFEITESAEFNDMDYLIKVLHEIKKEGFKISMDDFGTGYSCLGLLKDMPLDVLKIDKSFIDGIAVGDYNNKDMLMAKDILTIANHLGIKSLAEGVETFEQKEYLRQWGCHYIQGYFYSKPVTIANYEYLLKQNVTE